MVTVKREDNFVETKARFNLDTKFAGSVRKNLKYKLVLSDAQT